MVAKTLQTHQRSVSGNSRAMFSSSGITITDEVARQLSAVFACIQVVSEDIASLRWSTFSEDDFALVPKRVHAARILQRPNAHLAPFHLKELIVRHVKAGGNFYAEIERNKFGSPVALWPIHPWRVVNYILPSGEPIYWVGASGEGGGVWIRSENMIHVKGPTEDGYVGLDIISHAGHSLGIAKSGDDHAGEFFANGMQLSGIVSIPEFIEPENREAMEASLDKMLTGQRNRHRYAMLDGGAEWKNLALNPANVQLLESRKFSVEEIARWMRVPLHKIGHLAGNTNTQLEQQQQDYKDALVPIASRIEAEFNLKIFSQHSVVLRFDLDGLTRGDMQSRSEYYKTMWSIGAYSINDICKREGKEPVEGGDERFVPGNMVPLERALKEPEPQQAAPNPDVPDPMELVSARERGSIEKMVGKPNFEQRVHNFCKKHRNYVANKLGVTEQEARDYCDYLEQCVLCKGELTGDCANYFGSPE